jgi:hypothetical protein
MPTCSSNRKEVPRPEAELNTVRGPWVVPRRMKNKRAAPDVTDRRRSKTETVYVYPIFERDI